MDAVALKPGPACQVLNNKKLKLFLFAKFYVIKK